MNIEFANRLISLRKEHGYSQEDLAEKLGLSRQAVSKWERAESSPDTDNLIALSQLYQVSLDDLICSQGKNADTDKPKNIILKYQRTSLQKMSMVQSAEFVIDGETVIRVAPDTSETLSLDAGAHTVRVSIPFQGNEGGVVTTQVDIKAYTSYEMTYTVSNFDAGGTISVCKSGSGATVIKGRKTHMSWILIACIVMVVAGVCVALVSMLHILPSDDKEVTILELNTQGINGDVKITATEIKVIQPEYEDTFAVAVYFEIENQSKKEIDLSDSAYVDGEKTSAVRSETTLSLNRLDAGKRTTGYLCYSMPDNAQKIEIKFDIDSEERFICSLAIPADRPKEEETEKDVTITELNTPGINGGLALTATEIKIVRPEYNDKTAVALYFEAENQSEENIYISPTGYADGKKAEYTVYGDENFAIGYLLPGERMSGWVHYYFPENAQKIEVKFDTNFTGQTITFSFDIPQA